MWTRCCAAVLIILLLTSCGSPSEPDAGEPAPAPTSTGAPTDEVTEEPTASSSDEPAPTVTSTPKPEPTKKGTRIVTSGSEFGRMLFDSTGQAIYLFDVETTSKPRCYDACAEAWPPVLAKGQPVAGKGVDGALLATTKRADGALQVTYNGHPLYFYAHEGKREVKCHDISLNGGNWYVVRPAGDAAPPG